MAECYPGTLPLMLACSKLAGRHDQRFHTHISAANHAISRIPRRNARYAPLPL